MELIGRTPWVPDGWYRLVPGLSVPPLLFEEDEITVVVVGLRWVQARLPVDDAAPRALAKLAQVLPDRLRRRAAATPSLPRYWTTADRASLRRPWVR